MPCAKRTAPYLDGVNGPDVGGEPHMHEPQLSEETRNILVAHDAAGYISPEPLPSTKDISRCIPRGLRALRDRGQQFSSDDIKKIESAGVGALYRDVAPGAFARYLQG